jgi:hypothetical protein
MKRESEHRHEHHCVLGQQETIVQSIKKGVL